MPAEVVFGDLNGDGAVNDADLAIMTACLGSDDPDCCIADLNLDGRGRIRDLLRFGSSGVEFSPVR